MGKKDTPAPNYDKVAAASEKSAEIMAKLGREQLDFSKLQYEEMKPLAQRIAGQQIAAQDQQMAIAQEDRARYLSTFAPVEQGLVRRAQEFNTDAYQQQLAAQAAADAARAFDNTRNMNSRNLSRMGVSPGSGAFRSGGVQDVLGLASMRAGAMTGSRLQSEGEGMNRLYNAAALGRGLPGQTLGAYGGANASGSAAQQTAMAPGSQYMAGMGQGASTIGSGLQMQNQGLSNIMSTQANLYGQKMGAQSEMLGTAVGVGAAFI
jgi:hypothetical protein